MQRFDKLAVAKTAASLSASIPDDAVPTALAVNTAHAATQNTTLGNVRTRAATVLSSSALVVTFATSVGLVSTGPTDDGMPLDPFVALALLLVVIAIGVLTLVTQWPLRWSFDSGTDVFGGKVSLLEGQRAAFEKLEVDIARNEYLLGRVVTAYRWSVALLGVEAALVVFTVAVV